ncbi:MAG: DUF1697 domain-containing protein [Longimicrobiales bacterium]
MNEAHVALLRGINLAGRNRVAMSELVAIFRAAGCSAVRTYIQSGNVVFRPAAADVRHLPALITTALSERLGLDVPVVMRTLTELEQVAGNNPFRAGGADAKSWHVAFLRDHPEKAGLAALAPDRSPPDEFLVRGREIYLRCPNGIGRSKLTTQYFDSRLGTVSTVRNWNTVLALVGLLRNA